MKEPSKPGRFVAFDTETHLIRPGLLAPPPVCLSVAVRERTGINTTLLHFRFDRNEVFDQICHWCASPGITLVGAKVAYDFGVLMEWDYRLAPYIFRAYQDGRVLDVQLNEKLHDNARGRMGGHMDAHGKWVELGYGLADLELRILGSDRRHLKSGPDVWRLRYSELSGVPLKDWPEAAKSYAMDDATVTLQIMESQAETLSPDAPRQARAGLVLHLMSAWGVHTDADNISAFEAHVSEKFEDLTASLQAEGLVRPNGTRATRATQERMLSVCRELDIPVKLTKSGKKKLGALRVPSSALAWTPPAPMIEFTKRGRPKKIKPPKNPMVPLVCVDEEACENTTDPVLMNYAARTSLQTTVSSRIPDLWKGVETPIQAEFNVMVETGRTSCRKGKSANGFQLQNPPRVGDVRGCFVARPGYLFADADFEGLELCTVAQVCLRMVGESVLGEAINGGADPHLALGAKLLGFSYKEARERKREKVVKEARQFAKVANFGFPGGLGVEGFREFARGYGLRISTEQAKELKDTWFQTWPEFRAYFARIKSEMEGDAGCVHVTQLFSGRERGLCTFTQAANSYFQGLGADAAKNALWEVSRACYAEPASPLYGARPWNFVHDQILAEVREDKAHEQAVEMGRLMMEGANRFLPDVPTKCKPALSRHWAKDAESVYSAPPADGGRLVAWDDAKKAKARVFYDDGGEVQWA